LKKTKQKNTLRIPIDAKNMLPQKETMCFADKILFFGKGESHVSFKIPDNSPFIDENGFIDEVTFLEMVAQAMAAHAGVKRHSTSEKPLKGFLLGCKNFEINGCAKRGDVLFIKGAEQAAFGEFTIVNGFVYKDDILLASGEIKIWKEG